MNASTFVDFFRTKKEYYPISREFMLKYRQKETRDSYVAYAREMGLPVDERQDVPSQKWHLITACYDYRLSVNGGKDFTVGPFRCPELLLWLAEAAGVNEGFIREAAEIMAKEIDRFRIFHKNKPYSGYAVIQMNKVFMRKYGQTLQSMIMGNIVSR